MKKFVSGLLIGSIITLGIGAFAQVIDVSENTIKVKVNGKLSDAPNFVYDGRTYVQLRSVAELLNKEVFWDSETSTANINDKLPTEAEIGTRTNPINLNTDGISSKESGYPSKTYQFTTKITDIKRGAEAWEMIKTENQFNAQAKEGYEYILAKIAVTYVSGPDDDSQLQLSRFDFHIISSLGTEYENISLVLPKPEFMANLYKGASVDGWLGFQVKTDDTKPLVVVGRKYDGTGGCWFKAFK